jgi:hypothetical protein
VATIDSLHEKAVLELQSPTALSDSSVHDMVWTAKGEMML